MAAESPAEPEFNVAIRQSLSLGHFLVYFPFYIYVCIYLLMGEDIGFFLQSIFLSFFRVQLDQPDILPCGDWLSEAHGQILVQKFKGHIAS